MKTEWGVRGEREREREREQQINGERERERDRALDRSGNGVGLKWPLVIMNARVFLSIQINRTNKLSIKLGGSQILGAATFVLTMTCFAKHLILKFTLAMLRYF